MQAIRVLIVDDHRIFADAVAVRLDADPELHVVGISTSIPQAVSDIAQRAPDVIVLDMDLGSGSGLDLVRQLMAEDDGTGVVMLTCHDDVEHAAQAFRAGAAAFVSKAAPGELLLEAIRSVHRGEGWVPANLLRGVLRGLGAGPPPMTPDEAAVAKLSAREREVLGLMVAGCDRATIAERLYLSPNTVRTHSQNLLSKLHVQSSLEAVAIALRAGLRPADVAPSLAAN